MTSRVAQGALLLGVTACGAAPGGQAAAAAEPSCQVLRRTIPLPEGLGEASGVAWSQASPGAFWSHNDSGGDAELFLVPGMGGTPRRFALRGIETADWEDIAVGPCPGGRCLYVADIGNNNVRERPATLHVLAEPARGERSAGPVRSYQATYPGGKPRDAEAIFVLPDGAIYLITKGDDAPVELYRWPTPLRPRGVLQRVRELAPPPDQPGDQVTGASASPDGRFVAVRTYGTLNIFSTASLLDAAAPEAVLHTDLTPLGEGQGEGVTLANDGTVALVSESGTRFLPGSAALLRCQLP